MPQSPQRPQQPQQPSPWSEIDQAEEGPGGRRRRPGGGSAGSLAGRAIRSTLWTCVVAWSVVTLAWWVWCLSRAGTNIAEASASAMCAASLVGAYVIARALMEIARDLVD